MKRDSFFMQSLSSSSQRLSGFFASIICIQHFFSTKDVFSSGSVFSLFLAFSLKRIFFINRSFVRTLVHQRKRVSPSLCPMIDDSKQAPHWKVLPWGLSDELIFFFPSLSLTLALSLTSPSSHARTLATHFLFRLLSLFRTHTPEHTR